MFVMATKFANGVDLQGQRIISVGDPSSAQDAATKAYVDNLLAGLRWKQPVRVASTATVTVSNPGTAVFDGTTLISGDRILLKNQSAGAENGIYIFNGSSSALTRATDADLNTELLGATVLVLEGSTNADKVYTQTVDTITLGSTSLVWAQFGAGNTYTADETGIHLSGSQFQLVLDGSSLSKSGSGVRIADAAAGSGLTSASGVLSVGAGTGVSVAADTVSVDYSVVGTRYGVAIGNGSATQFVITHGLTNKNVQVSVYETTSGAMWLPDVSSRTTTTVTLDFAVAPSSNFFTVVVE